VGLTPQTAAAVDWNYAVIKSNTNSTGTLYACRDFVSDTQCGSTSPRCNLSPGQNTKTKCGWADADGYILPSYQRQLRARRAEARQGARLWRLHQGVLDLPPVTPTA
jgi:hypothetical protein